METVYTLKCTLCGADETELRQEIELLGNLVAFQEHAIAQHHITREAFRASKGEKYKTEQHLVYFWELPDGRTWLKAVKPLLAPSPSPLQETEAGKRL